MFSSSRVLASLSLAVLVIGCCLAAQAGVTVIASVPGAAVTGKAESADRILLGQSAVPLYGPWKFTVGDSPVDPATHRPVGGSGI